MENIKVLVRGGNASFWFDKWLASGVLSVSVGAVHNSKLCIKDGWINNSRNSDRLLELVGSELTEEILQNVPTGKSGQDMYIWKPALDGSFSIGTAWEAMRGKSLNTLYHDCFWHNMLPKSISMCLWKVWFNCLAVDDRVQSKGIYLASSCDCCAQKATETINDDRVQSKCCDGSPVYASDALENQSYGLGFKFQIERPRTGAKEVKIVTWSKPPSGWVNLNCDGSCRGNLGNSGGGGIIRDSYSVVKAVFSTHFGNGTNNSAELKAIVEGILLCKQFHFFNIIIESDSRIVVDWLWKGRCTLWYLWDLWDDLNGELIG
ncbi:hypothetical protein F2P56_018694 [Juglans regia]|uniref:RNase H type-1 domain-containing protein n=2 Tax=Juglans regia TaxID=51240 RepID=A0A833UNS8_JUGRE|nr:uncharacterized protein LOC108986934 [Juglans regia]KAF5462708.1 hypothetical protein F2P56_018694 [Juglans regia]